jgi:DNA-binding winged helix-turn-helix (wHTH) protein
VIDLSCKPVYRFNDVEIDAPQGCVRRAGQEVYLRQQTFQVLLYLLKRRERLVTKEELFENIWKDAAVTDNALLQCIFDIRKTLGDDSRNPRFIKTFPKVGYRFISPVEEIYPTAERHGDTKALRWRRRRFFPASPRPRVSASL